MSDVTFFEQLYARYMFFIDSFFRSPRHNSEAVKNAEFRKKWYIGAIYGRRACRSLRHALFHGREGLIALLDEDPEHAAALKVVETIWRYEAELYYSMAMHMFEVCTIEHKMRADEFAGAYGVGNFAPSTKLDGLAQELESYGLSPADIRERIVGQLDHS